MTVSALRFQGVYKFAFQEKAGSGMADHPVFRKWDARGREGLKAGNEEVLYRMLMQGTAEVAMSKPDYKPGKLEHESLFEAGGMLKPNDIWLLTDDAQGDHATQLGSLAQMAEYRTSGAIMAFKKFTAGLAALAARNPEIKVQYEMNYPNKMEYDPTGTPADYFNWTRQMHRRGEVSVKDWEIQGTPPIKMPKRNPFTPQGYLNPGQLEVVGPDTPAS
jgi:hypothetical protein